MGLPQHPMDQAHKRARKHQCAFGLGPRMRPRAILRGGDGLPVSSRDFGPKPVRVLIIRWSQVRVLVGPPFVTCWRGLTYPGGPETSFPDQRSFNPIVKILEPPQTPLFRGISITLLNG